MERVDYQSIVIQDLTNYHKRNELNLSPWYQRRSVWTTSQRSYLINTLFEQKPIPAIYIRHTIDLDRAISVREVVDGQQRCRSIIEYVNNDFSARHPTYTKKVKFSDLKESEKQKFLLTSIPVGFLLGAEESDVIDIFGRINSVGKSLNAQEKRNAKFSGEFKQLALSHSSRRTKFWKDFNLFTANDISRMNEVQFVSDVIVNFIEGLTDYSAAKLDRYYSDYEDDFPQREEIDKKLNLVLDLINNFNPDVIKDTIFVRQPIFFSLLIALDSINYNIDLNKLEGAILNIDELYNSENIEEKEIIEFREACSSSTQRIGNRRIRHNFILKFLQ